VRMDKMDVLRMVELTFYVWSLFKAVA